MQHSERSQAGGALRRLVLGSLFAVGAVLALAPRGLVSAAISRLVSMMIRVGIGTVTIARAVGV